eukprot:1650344-Pleurochrysis_carterae.AAC.2
MSTPVSSEAPREMHMAIDAPMDVPQIRSKHSRMRFPPRRLSTACRTSVGFNPLTPPPSMHKIRSGRSASDSEKRPVDCSCDESEASFTVGATFAEDSSSSPALVAAAVAAAAVATSAAEAPLGAQFTRGCELQGVALSPTSPTLASAISAVLSLSGSFVVLVSSASVSSATYPDDSATYPAV